MYSQYGEDEIVARLLGDRRGWLLDIGAWDPETFSNSRLLIEKGWSAILVEPSPGPLRSLVRQYAESGRVIVVSAAVTTADEHVFPIRVTDDGVSTADIKTLEKWKDKIDWYGKLWVSALPITKLLQQFGSGFDFVSIDTEGTSVDLAIAFLAAGPRPLVMCVEHDDRLVELLQEAQRYGYRAAHTNGTNVILVL